MSLKITPVCANFRLSSDTLITMERVFAFLNEINCGSKEEIAKGINLNIRELSFFILPAMISAGSIKEINGVFKTRSKEFFIKIPCNVDEV